MKHIFIVNPTSGRGAALEAVPHIEKYFADHPAEYEIIQTERPNHAKEIAAQYHKEDDVRLYSVGGDGTLWEVINGINEGVPFAIVPCGTGNDFFRMVKHTHPDVTQYLSELENGEDKPIDYGVIRHEGQPDTRFINCFCFGLDAEVNKHVMEVGKKRSWIPKKLLYVVSALEKVFHPITVNYTIERKEGVFHNGKMVTAIMNGRYYGGGFTPTPLADIQDGRFDICMIDALPAIKIFPLLAKYAKGDHLSLDAVQLHHLQNCTITFDKPTNCTVDGELFVYEKVEFEMVHHGLTLRVPKEK